MSSLGRPIWKGVRYQNFCFYRKVVGHVKRRELLAILSAATISPYGKSQLTCQQETYSKLLIQYTTGIDSCGLTFSTMESVNEGSRDLELGEV